MEHESNHSKDISIVLDKFITLAKNTYEIEISDLPSEFHLEKSQGVYKTIADSFTSLTNGVCWVWAFNKERNLFIYKASSETNHALEKLDLKPTLLNSLNHEWPYKILKDKEIRDNELVASLLKPYSFEGVVLLPMHSPKQADLVGTIICCIPKNFGLDKNALTILASLATQAALAVDHTRLVERLGTLQEIAAKISKEMQSLSILRLILDKALDLPQFATGQLYLTDRSQRSLYLVDWRVEGDKTPPQSIPFGKSILGEVAKSRKSEYIADISAVKDNDLGQEIGSLFAVPIIAGENLLGVLSIQSTKPSAFTELDRYLIGAFAHFAAISLWAFLRSMEVAYTNLVLVAEDHASGSMLINIKGIADNLCKRLTDGNLDSTTLELAQKLNNLAYKGLKRVSDQNDIFDQGRTLGSDLFNSGWRIESIPIDSLVRDLVETLKPEMDRYNIRLDFECNCVFYDVNGLRPLLISAFRQILDNAIEELMEQSSEDANKLIRIEITSDESNDIQVLISDTGRGIPEEIRERIFKDRISTKSKVEGFGLRIAKYIFDCHGSVIRLSNETVGGATFIINLPARRGRHQ